MKVKPRAVVPEMRKVAVAPIYSKFSSYPSHGLTPQRLAAIFREADEGDVYRQMELFEEMEEHDPHLYAQLQTRKNAVTGLDWEIAPASDDPQDGAVAEFVREQLGSIKNLEDIFLDLLDAIGKGISVSEIMWNYSGGHVCVDRISQVQPKLLLWDNDDVMRIVTDEAPTGIEIPPNKFIVHRYKAKSGHPSRAGILRVCSWMYLFKNYDVKDWAAFIEVFGLPLRLGKYAVGASQDDKDALWRALVQMGTDAAGMVPDGTSIEFISTDAAKGSANGIYETMARYCDEQISKAILGQTLTSDSGGGSYAQSKTHNDVRHDLSAADCKALAATVRDDLIRPLVLFNFGPEMADHLPQLVFDCAESEDLTALSGILNTLNNMGVPIPLAHIYKKFRIPEPEPGDAVTRLPGFQQAAFKLQANKDTGGGAAGYQERADRLAEAAEVQGVELFKEIFHPLREMAKGSSTLEELRAALADPATVERLYADSVSGELTGLLADTMLAADLAGRLRAHE